MECEKMHNVVIVSIGSIRFAACKNKGCSMFKVGVFYPSSNIVATDNKGNPVLDRGIALKVMAEREDEEGEDREGAVLISNEGGETNPN